MVRVEAQRPTPILRVALAVPHYRPEVGDHVLILQSAPLGYVIGVVGAARMRSAPLADGRLAVEPTTDGGVSIRASGPLEIRSATELGLESPLVRTRAGRAELEARTVVESTERAYRHASEFSSSTAGRARTCIEGDHELSAGRTSIVSTDDTTIDGKRVLLG